MAPRGARCDCRKLQLELDCCRVGLVRRSGRRIRRRADDADHISALPDDLLLQILAGLGCARAQANTSLLSRRWRGLWSRSPRLLFHLITPDQLHAALGRIARPAGSLRFSVPYQHRLSPDRMSSLLGATAPLAPAELSVDICADTGDMRGCSHALDLPCSDRTASLSLYCFGLRLLRLRPAGDFTALESLSLGPCHMDLGDLLPRCPCLRELRLSGTCDMDMHLGDQLPWCPCLRELRLSDWKDSSITVHSPSLQELHFCSSRPLCCVDIVTPVLKKLRFGIQGMRHGINLSLSAPIVDDLSWYCKSRSTRWRFGVRWRMWSLHLKTLDHSVHTQQTKNREDTCLQPQHRAHGNVLLLDIAAIGLGDMSLTFEQEISQNRVRNVYVLELKIATGGHVYGAMVLELLRLCTSVQKLKVDLNRFQTKECNVNCHCDQPNNWKDQTISLTDLKEVKIDGFNGEDHEVSLLKVLLRCAVLLESVNLNFSRNVSRRRRCSAYLELPSILKAHPLMKFNIYHWCGDQVMFG